MIMSIRINLLLGVIGILTITSTLSRAQSDKAIFRVQVFKSDSTLIREGTGFFMDGNHGFTHAYIFNNATFGRIITKDSTIHKVIKINGFDPSTGLTRMELDNMLTAKITKLSSAKTFSAQGAGVSILYSDGIQSVKTISRKISAKDDFIGYGPAILLDDPLTTETFGSPVLNSAGAVEGFVMPLEESSNRAYIANTNAIVNLKSLSKTISEFGDGLKVFNYIPQGIDAYMAGNNDGAISAFGKAKSTMPDNVTSFYYSGLINFNENRIGAARSDLSRAIEIDPNLSQPYYIRGQINYNNEDFKAAIADFDQAENLKINESEII
jgi:hypothetical protein